MPAPPPPLDLAKDLYRLLRLPRMASRADIQRSYREMAMDLHPDRHRHRHRLGASCCEKRTAEFREVSEAYRILGDRRSRAEYDRRLLAEGSGGGTGGGGGGSAAAMRNPFYRRV